VLLQLLAEKAAQYPNKKAVVGEARALTYGELYAEARKIAGCFQSLGLKTGDAVLLGMPPSPEFHAALFGAAALGLVVIPALPSGKLSDQIVAARPTAALGEPCFLGAVRQRGALRHFIEWRRDGLKLPTPSLPFSRDRVFRDEKIFAVSTSGTTGDPQLYLRSAETVVERARMRAAAYGLRADDVLLATRPYNSGSAINNHVIVPVCAGCTIVVQERFERFKAAQSIGAAGVTVLYAVPFVYEMLASIPRSVECDFSSVRLCIAGGAPLSRQVAEAFKDRFGLALRQRYAGTHLYPAFTYNPDGPPTSVGRIDGIFPIRILDEGGAPAPAETVGEITFYFPGFPESWKRLARTNPNLKGDYLYTGDLGRTDAAGNVYVVGRRSRFIKVAGNRVEPAEVESVLREHPAVKDALVVGVSDGAAEERVEARVSVAENVSEQELLKHCAQRLDPYKCPRRIEIKSELPRNDHGKISRRLFDGGASAWLLVALDLSWLAAAP